MNRDRLERLLTFKDADASVDPDALRRHFAADLHSAAAHPELAALVSQPDAPGALPALELPVLRGRSWWRVAVAAALLLGATLFFLPLDEPAEQRPAADPAGAAALIAGPVQYATLRTSRVRMLKGRDDRIEITRSRWSPSAPRVRFKNPNR